uniref:tachykinin-3a isoform X2 n=1 Tax=Monopterus albus TaxID=43700 RepID=UPI0009B31639|nr:uncharacterized protein LOC109968330 isoform X2 [Monopterus albus]
MRRSLLLVTLFLIMKPRYSHSRCEEPGSRTSTSDQTTGLDILKRNIMKRYNDLDYDSFVGLMGRRNADANAVQSPQKKNGPWREYPEKRGIFLNKCRLRFLQGL